MADPDLLSADGYYAVIPTWVLFADISANAVRLYGVLRRRADKSNGECYPNRKTLCQESRIKSEKTLDSAKEELVAIGALLVTKRWNGAEPTSNLYTVIGKDPQNLPGVGQNLTPGGVNNDGQTTVIKPQSLNLKDKEQSFFTDPDCLEICEYLANAISERGFRSRPEDAIISGKNWLNEARLLLKGEVGTRETKESVGSLTTAQIRKAIDFAMDDTFWHKNVLSPASLRKAYPRLRMEAVRTRNTRSPKGLAALQRYKDGGQNVIEQR